MENEENVQNPAEQENAVAQAAQEVAIAGAAQGAEKSAPVTKRDAFIENMRRKYPDITDEDELYAKAMEGYDSDHEYRKKQSAENKKFADIIDKEPEVADFFRSVIEGEDAGVAMSYLSDVYKAYMNGDIDSEEFKTRRTEIEKSEKEKADALKKQEDVYMEWCKKRGYDPEEWIKKANDAYFTKMGNNAMDEDTWDLMDRGMRYNDDVELARTQGRNENIVAQKKEMAKPTNDGTRTTGGANVSSRPALDSRFGAIASSRQKAKNL